KGADDVPLLDDDDVYGSDDPSGGLEDDPLFAEGMAELTGGNQDNNGDTQSQNKDKTSVAQPSFLALLLGTDDSKNQDLSDDELRNQATADQNRLAQFLGDGIKNFGFDEELIPEDLDPNDPRQMRTLLGTVSQQVMAETLRLMFEPMQ